MTHLDQIKQMCDDIYSITGIKAVFYDADMRLIYSHPRSMIPFCSYVRREEGLEAECLRCDCEGFYRCRMTGDLVIYRCHMGLTEAVSPVMDNDTVIGYILFGQMLSEGTRNAVIQKIEKGSYRNPPELLLRLRDMSTVEDEIIKASARLMSMCASNIRLKSILKIRRSSLATRIDAYISRHLGNTGLSIGMICRAFGISRSTLYTVSKNAFNTGITEHIRKRRLQRAIAMIRQGGIPIYKVAEEAGFLDPNYMAKLIKKETGATPKKLQKMTAQEC